MVFNFGPNQSGAGVKKKSGAEKKN